MKNINKANLISFDVFDTLITRKCATPMGIFKLIQHKLIKDNDYVDLPLTLRENFVTIRHETELYSQAKELFLYDKRETTFDKIYDIIGLNYNLSQQQIINLKNLEIVTEKNNIVPIKKNITLLKDFINKNKTVILISDIYFSQEIIKSILTSIDGIFNNIKIYTSADYSETKRNATLYKIVKKDYFGLKWYHVGDNKFSDCTCAKWEGANAILYTPQCLKPYEKYLLSKSSNNNFKEEFIIGLARSLRLNNNDAKYQFGCSFAAPILYSYIKWVIENCASIGIDELFFVARDGYILKLIADIIIKELNLNFNTHYFYSSRIASRVLTNNNYYKFIDNIFSELVDLQNVDFILNRLNINIKDLNTIDNFSIQKLKKQGLKYLKVELYKNEKFKILILNKNIEKKNLFIKYLKQEFTNVKNNRVAFIDINGSGKTQDYLAEQVEPFYKGEIHNYYLHNSIDMIQQEKSIKHSYLFTSDYLSAFIELLCRTTDGQTLGYHVENNKVVPYKEFEQNKHIIAWGYSNYIDGIKDFAKEMCKLEKINNIEISSNDIYVNYFKFVKTQLDYATANIIGSIPFSMFSNEEKYQEAAPKMCFNLLLKKDFDFLSISLARCKFFNRIFWQILLYVFNFSTYAFISRRRRLAYIKCLFLKFDIRKYWGIN